MDLQKAIDTIGRVHKHAIEVDKSSWRLDLKGCDFDGVSFHSGFFWAADLSDSRFEGSNFREAILESCLLRGSLLNFADFFRTNLTGAKLDPVRFNHSSGSGGGFTSANLRGATFIAADISGVSYLGRTEATSETFGTKDTKVSAETRDRMLDHASHDNAHLLRAVKGDEDLSEADKRLVEELEKTGFQNWSPYDSSDMATGHLLSELYEELGMKKWPYW